MTRMLPLLYLCDTTGFRSTSSIALEDFSVRWERGRETATVSYAQHKAERSLGMQYPAAGQQERWKDEDRTSGKWRLLLFQALTAPEMERKKGMRETKTQGMTYQSQDFTVPGSTQFTGISAPT